MSWLSGFRGRTTPSSELAEKTGQCVLALSQEIGDLHRTIMDLRRELSGLRAAQGDWAIDVDEKLEALEVAIRASGPSQAADIAKVCLDRMAQVATMRQPQPYKPPLDSPRLGTQAAVPEPSEDDEWAAGGDIMEIRG
jgi:hypothetical protein